MPYIRHSDGKAIAFGYDDLQRISSVTNDGFAYLYERHDFGCVTNEAVRCGDAQLVVLRTVDGRARVDGAAVLVTNVAHAAVTRGYDEENRLSACMFTNSLGRACSIAFAYDGLWLTNSVVTVPGGQVFNRRIIRDSHRRGLVRRNEWTFGGQSVFWLASDYDLLGRATNSTDSINAVREWLYNSRSEVSGAQIGTMPFTYNYDSIGNRTAASVNDATTTYTANNLNQYTSTLRASESPCSYQYDADGNLISDGINSYTYDCENNLVSIQPVSPTNGALRVLNTYDHLNRRIRKTVERYEDGDWIADRTTTFVYDGWNLLLETTETANGTTDTREYFWGPDLSGTEQGAGGVGGLLAVSVNGMFYFPCYDHNGNIMCYVSESGTVAATYLYDAFGNTINQAGTRADTFRHRFSTKYFDDETGHYYYGRRFYIPSVGRWLNRDPIEEQGGENLYAFCVNNPNVYIDAFGEISWGQIASGFVQLAGGVMTTIVAVNSIWGSGGVSTPIAYALGTWGVMNMGNGINAILAGFGDRGSPEALQVQMVEQTYEFVTGNKMSPQGELVTQYAYYAVDITCSCYTIALSWKTMVSSGIIYKYRTFTETTDYLKIPSTGNSAAPGIKIIKVESQIHLDGSFRSKGALFNAGSILIDYKGVWSDVYQLSDDYFNPESK